MCAMVKSLKKVAFKSFFAITAAPADLGLSFHVRRVAPDLRYLPG